MAEDQIDDFSKITRDRLKELRLNHNMSLEKFANAVGVRKSTVQRWENGDFKSLKLPIASRICDYFGVNPLWLMGYDVPKYSSTDDAGKSKSVNEYETIIIDKLHKMNNNQLVKVNKFIDDFILEK